ncbi:MAG TPA: T9SS type A sorting domain-containing protein [Ignavibacteriaceae bacterium]|nr:T9SS type A sorting domain-containing protein [Ignavibacteriaceae bacterium]
MKKFYKIIFIAFLTNTAFSQWSTNPYENLQVAVHGGNIHVVSDGNGGALITFNNFDYDVVTTYMQAVDRYGYLKWTEPKILADGPGPINYIQDIFHNPDGTILIGYTSGYTYVDPIPRFEYDPYVQKTDSNGNKLWGENGIRLRADSTGKEISGIDFCYDGDGGLYAFWNFNYEVNYPPYFYDSLFIQHISNDGVRLWGENGIFIDDSIFSALNLWVHKDDSGGIYIQYRKKNTEHYIKKYDAIGNLNWIVVNLMSFPRVISDDQGGIVVNGVKVVLPRQLIINRISSEGEKLWGDEGIIVDSVGANYANALMLLNSDNTVSVFWNTEWYQNSDVLLQRYTLDGDQLWQEHLKIGDLNNKAGIIETDNNSNIVFWRQRRDTTETYAQKIDALGNILWNEDKLMSYLLVDEPNVITTENYGAILVWRTDPPWGGIYAQQISKYGNLGEVITTVIGENNNINASSLYLAQNYPNPFNPITKIQYAVGNRQFVSLKVYDILGRQVATLVNDEKSAGSYTVEFNAGELSSGVYYYKLTAGDFSEIKKLVLVK